MSNVIGGVSLVRNPSDRIGKIYIVMEGEKEQKLLFIYPTDQMYFNPADFLGKTEAEALDIKDNRDLECSMS